MRSAPFVGITFFVFEKWWAVVQLMEMGNGAKLVSGSPVPTGRAGCNDVENFGEWKNQHKGPVIRGGAKNYQCHGTDGLVSLAPLKIIINMTTRKVLHTVSAQIKGHSWLDSHSDKILTKGHFLVASRSRRLYILFSSSFFFFFFLHTIYKIYVILVSGVSYWFPWAWLMLW